MLWWFLILGISTAVVVSAAVSIVVRVRKQMKAAHHAHPDSTGPDGPLPPEL
jgi:hypothetical protein